MKRRARWHVQSHGGEWFECPASVIDGHAALRFAESLIRRTVALPPCGHKATLQFVLASPTGERYRAEFQIGFYCAAWEPQEVSNVQRN